MIWKGEASEINLRSSHYAPLFTELIFSYGDAFSVEGQNVIETTNGFGHQIISGLKTKPFITSVQGNYLSVGLILKPFCYGLLKKQFGTSMFNHLSEIIFESLINTKKPDFTKLEKHLLKLFNAFDLDTDLQKFEKFSTQESLKSGLLTQFNQGISISQKSFIQKFKDLYQITPNAYLKLRKVNQSIQQLQQNPSQKLSHIAYDTGFYDQSHFIRSFKAVTGFTPKAFRKTTPR